MRGRVISDAVKRVLSVGLVVLLSAWLVLTLPSVGLACPELSYCYASVTIPLDPDALPSPCTGVTPVATGACCVAQACAGAAEGCYITRVELKVGGTLVNSYQNPGGDRYRTYKIAALWSSTNFSNGATVGVTCNVWDSGPHSDSDTHSVRVVNKGYVGNNDKDACGELEYGLERACWIPFECGQMKIDTWGTTGDHKQPILTNYIPNSSTVFFMYSHASDCTSFGSSCAHREGTPDEYMSDAEVENARQSKDPCEYPGYEFVFIDGCCSAAEPGACGCSAGDACATMQSAFFARAYLGWLTKPSGGLDHFQFSTAVFDYLEQGWTLEYAAAEAFRLHRVSCPGGGDAEYRILGDGALTLTTVCGGQRQQPIQWYRPTINEGNPGA